MQAKYLGRKGELATLLKEVKDLTEEEKPKIGALANTVKEEIVELFNNATNEIDKQFLQPSPAEFLDITLPGKKNNLGHLHPISLVQQELEDIFILDV